MPTRSLAAVFLTAICMENAVIATSGPVALGAGPVRVELDGAGASERVAARVARLEPDERVYLVLKDLRAVAQPGVLYAVYFGLPAGTEPSAGHPGYVGTLNFFSAESGTPVERSYDVTRNLRELRARNLLTDASAVTVVPSGSPAPQAEPTIGRIELVVQRASS